jgi:hypothetical protein
MDPELIPLAVTAAVVILTLTVVATVLRKKGRRLAERLAPAFELGTSRPAGPLGIGVDGLYRGYSCRYLVRLASQYDRGGATLKLDATSPFSWSAERSQAGTRLLVSLGVLRDLEVGDEELDERLRFAADDVGALLGLIGTASFRSALLELVSTENFESVRVRTERLEVMWSPRAAQLDEDPEALRGRLEAAVDLLTAAGSPPRLRAPS